MSEKETLVERNGYLAWLIRWKDRRMIKVVSGVRRSGKSTLFTLFRSWLLSHGTAENQIITVNFEDIAFEPLCNYKELYTWISARLVSGKMNYIFLDEIQHVSEYEKAVDSLYIKENCDVYITGSNAWFMSGELATLLTGRYVELKMLPLSFAEFCSGIPEQLRALSAEEKFNYYIENGSFPYILQLTGHERDISEYLGGVYNSILLKDIVRRLKVSDVDTLERIIKFLMHNTGSQTSPANIANTLTSSGNKVDQKTVSRYLRGLCDSLLFYEVPRCNIKRKQFLTTQNKYYPVDTGLRRLLIKTTERDAGHLLENIVFLELMRRSDRVYTGQIDSQEIDFIAEQGNGTSYYQVALTTLDEATLSRELFPLQKIHDSYPKYLLTLDTVFRTADYDGINKLNVIDWLSRE